MQKQVRFNKLTAWLLTLAMLFTTLPGFTLTAFAEDNDNLCAHHAEHTADCGYVEGVTGVECTHTHDDTCGYAEAVEGVDCTCEDTDENGAIIHTEGCGYVAPVDDVTCSHVHDSECGYVEAVEASPCTYECALCGLTEITAWSWIDEWEMIDPDTGVLALPGASADNPAYFDDIVSMLPVEITATVEGGTETVALDGWACPGYPEEGAYSGNYIFTAALPEGYALAEDAPALTVTVELGGAALFAGGTYDFSTIQSVLTINSSNEDQYDGATITGSYTLDLKSDILVIDGVTVNLTIENLTLKTTGATTSGYSPIDLRNNATLNLTVKGTNTLSAEYHAAGIHVPADCTLNITAESTGTLTVNGGNGYGGGAGIGADGNGYTEGYGSTTQTCGTINIAGGTIIATGGTHYIGGIHATAGGAGIGGSSAGTSGGEASTGNITISGGNVTATGGGQSAGIGGGECGYVESITITGGTVKASAEYGAAIGTGQDGTTDADIACGDKMEISITGGTVTADGNIGYGEVLQGSPMTGGSVTIGTNASVVLTDGHKIDHGDASNYAIIPVTLNVYDGRLTDTAEWITMEATQSGSRVGGADVELAVSDYHGTGKVNFVVPVGNATGATNFTVTGDSFSVTGSATLTTSGVTVNCGQQLYPVTLAFLDDTKFASNTDYNVNENGLTVTSGGSAPADGTIMATLPTTIKYHSASMGTMVVWLAAGTYNISVRSSGLNDGVAMGKEITVTGSTTLVMLDNSEKEAVGTLDLSYGPIKFYTDSDAYKVEYYASSEASAATTAEVLVSAPFVVTQTKTDTNPTTTNTITIENWGTDVPLDLTIDGLNIETSEVLLKDNNASYIDINGSAVNLNLSGSSSLKSTYYGNDDFTAALVSVDGTSSLTIDGSGSLSVNTYAYALGAAIGGDAYSEVGTITIEGGTVNANGGTGAAIGTGYGGSTPGKGHAVITITGGTVNANNYSGYGTAIGAGSSDGSNANTASVMITGGEVTATGIIGASRGSAIVEISGGTVNATAYTANATIGGQVYYMTDGGDHLNMAVTISGGIVNATNTGSGPAIGGSGISDKRNAATNKTPGKVTISGGIVTATNNNTETAAIGASRGYYIARTDVAISGGRVTATNKANGGVAIGGGSNLNSGDSYPYAYSDVTITGGTVDATGIIGSAAKAAAPQSTQYATVKITGGSVNGEVWAYSDAITNTGATNGSSSVYKITADLSSTVGTDAEVTSASIAGNTSYVFKDVYTDASGKIYLWLPAKATDAEFGGVIYSGTPNTDEELTRQVKLEDVAATSVTDTTATITASVDPGATVHYLASTKSFANGTALANAAGAKSVTADSSGNVTINLTGLTPSTTYKYYLTSKLGTSYSSVESVDVTTEKPNLAGAMVTFSPESSTYTRKAQFPTVTVTWNGQALTADSDYYVTWTDEKGATVTELKNAGTYTATINGVQGYIGKVTKTFTINKATPVITWENESWMIEYTGSAARIVALLTLQDGEKGELTYSYVNNDTPGVSGNGLPSQVGDYTVTASYAATDNYEAAQETTQLKIDPADISGAEVTVSGTHTYTGSAQTPAPVVELYGNTLEKNTDYTVSYTNNINAGTATVTVTGKGNCTGEATASFTINQKQTAVTAPVNKTLDIIPSEVSDVTELLPSTVITNDGDFTITWSCDNLNTTPNGTSTFKWTITDEKFSNYTADKTSDTIIVTNGNAIAVNHTGTDKETTYGKNTYDVSQMFTIDENAGTASYSAAGITGAGTISGSALTITKAGTIKIKLTTEAKGNYAAGEATATLTVAKGTGEGTVTMDGWTYGGIESNPVAESETNGTENVSYQYKVKDADDSTYTDSKPTNAGNYTVKATFAETDLYKEAVATADFTIAKAQAVITVDTTPIVKTYGDTWELPTATSTFGKPVADKKVTDMVNAGTYTVTYTVEGTSNYNGDEKTVSVTISPKKIEKPMADKTEFVYDGKEKTYSVAASDYYTVTGNKMTNAGSQDVIVALKDKENYTWNNGETTDEKFTFSIAPKPITAATVGAFAELTYTGEAQTPAAKVTIDGLTVTGTWSKVTNVADKTTFTADGNFTGTIADKETGMTAADMSAGITASGYNGTYDGEGHTITVSLSGVAEGATVKYGITEGTYDLDAAPSYTDSGSETVFYQVTKTNCGTVTGSATVEIAKKKIDSAIVLTAPVKNTAPQTEITGTGYTATVVWSPEVTDKFGYNTEYTATVTITTDGNHTVEGIAANGYTAPGAKTVTNEENSNVITVAYEKTGSRPSSGGGSSNTTTTTTKNDDGSTTKTTTNKSTGTTTETTTYPDGSTTTVETKKDGTVTTTEKDKDGNTTTTVENPDGTSTTTEKNKDGSETVVEKEADGTTTTTEKDSEGNKTITTEKADGTTTTEETKKDGTKVTTETNADGETTAEVEAKGETEVVIPIPDTEKVQMVVITDEDGNNTYITEIETTDNGVAVTTNGNASVSVMSGEKKEFVDVHPVDHWSEKSVDFVHILGLMNGTSVNHFSPDVHLTRAMLVTVLYRAEGEPEIANDESFADVEGGSYYEKAVAWAKANGIVNGTSATTFEPNTNITREQIAAIMHRYADFKGHDVSVGENTNILSYTDVHHVSEYAIGSMQYAVGSGLIKGKTETTLNPKDKATRAEAAAILERFIKAN